jgi:hypothetical protein
MVRKWRLWGEKKEKRKKGTEKEKGNRILSQKALHRSNLQSTYNIHG